MRGDWDDTDVCLWRIRCPHAPGHTPLLDHCVKLMHL